MRELIARREQRQDLKRTVNTIMPKDFAMALDLTFRYRWLIALAVFCVCVALRISGSSIGVYNEVFPTQITPERTTLVGKPRWIRSDEFGVQTPTFFSQQYNQHQLYSQRMSLDPTNMVLNYYSPVWDWTALGKPLMWGYPLFAMEQDGYGIYRLSY